MGVDEDPRASGHVSGDAIDKDKRIVNIGDINDDLSGAGPAVQEEEVVDSFLTASNAADINDASAAQESTAEVNSIGAVGAIRS